MSRSNLKRVELVTYSAAAFLTAGLYCNALAVDLPPGTTITPVPEVEVGGIEVTSVSAPLTSGNLSGTLTSTVLSGDPFNLLGGLTFTYQLAVDETSHAIARFTVSSFEGSLVDVGYSLPGDDPYVADRKSGGAVVGFSFPFAIGLPAGSESALLVVRTDSAQWESSVASLINGGQTTVDSLAPQVIPEPGTYALALVGGFALLLFFRRRN